MSRLYLVSLPERIWHWTNAALFITLAATGLMMHASGDLETISLAALIRVHNAAALLFAIDFASWLALEIYTGRIRQYLKVERDIVKRLMVQGKFYMYDIFFGREHPYPSTPESKFNPLQRVTYIGLMFVLAPLQILTGAVMYGFTLRIDWLMNLGAFRTIALTHTALSYMLIAFLAGHLYLATTGDTPTSLIVSMFTGYQEEAHSGKETSNETA